MEGPTRVARMGCGVALCVRIPRTIHLWCRSVILQLDGTELTRRGYHDIIMMTIDNGMRCTNSPVRSQGYHGMIFALRRSLRGYVDTTPLDESSEEGAVELPISSCFFLDFKDDTVVRAAFERCVRGKRSLDHSETREKASYRRSPLLEARIPVSPSCWSQLKRSRRPPCKGTAAVETIFLRSSLGH